VNVIAEVRRAEKTPIGAPPDRNNGAVRSVQPSALPLPISEGDPIQQTSINDGKSPPSPLAGVMCRAEHGCDGLQPIKAFRDSATGLDVAANIRVADP